VFNSEQKLEGKKDIFVFIPTKLDTQEFFTTSTKLETCFYLILSAFGPQKEP